MAYTTINKSTDYFRTKLYTGNQTARSITFDESGNMQPDLVWLKPRSGTYGSGYHRLFDNVRGAGKQIYSNATNAENDNIDELSSFDTNGFSLGTQTGSNGSSTEFASWNWKANGSGSANTDGTINTLYTSANTTAGFSISTYAGTGSSGTIGHGLGVAPKMIIIKRTSGTEDWLVYTTADGSLDYLILNSSGASGNSGNAVPTNSVWSVGSNQVQNASGSNYVAYCFAEKTGYSKFGSYIGNGTSGVDGAGDGTFVYTGFKPSMIIIKPTSTTGNWQILDNKRPGFNESDNLAPNNNAAENTSNDFVDLVSNGFKLRSGTYSASGVTYIFMAFAEAPLVGSNNVPCTAR